MANSGLFKTSYLNENKSLKQKCGQIININDESESANSPDASQRVIGGREENQSCFGKIQMPISLNAIEHPLVIKRESTNLKQSLRKLKASSITPGPLIRKRGSNKNQIQTIQDIQTLNLNSKNSIDSRESDN